VVVNQVIPVPAQPPTPPDPRATVDATIPDRRRPGRIDTANPHLIALMRGRFRGDLPEPDDAGPDDAAALRDDLSAARGIGLAVLIGVLLWAVIAALVIAY
jgi:hypothetical protein